MGIKFSLRWMFAVTAAIAFCITAVVNANWWWMHSITTSGFVIILFGVLRGFTSTRPQPFWKGFSLTGILYLLLFYSPIGFATFPYHAVLVAACKIEGTRLPLEEELENFNGLVVDYSAWAFDDPSLTLWFIGTILNVFVALILSTLAGVLAAWMNRREQVK